MLCDFLISLVASYIAVLVSAAGLINGTAGIVFGVIEVIIPCILISRIITRLILKKTKIKE